MTTVWNLSWIESIYLNEREMKVNFSGWQKLHWEEIPLLVMILLRIIPGGSSEDSRRPRTTAFVVAARTKIFDPPQAFPDMPNQEEEWVYKERMLMKSRRKKKNNGTRGGRQQQHQRRRQGTQGPRILDTPELIAEKRAQRKAKREHLLLQEQNEK